MKTPEQVVHDRLNALDFGHSDVNGKPIDPADFTEDALRDGWFTGADVIRWCVEAIEADRAQHDLGYARSIIDRHDARAVIWERGDIELVLNERIEEREVGPLDQAGFDAIIDRAMESGFWRGLDDDTENGWEAIGMALDEAMEVDE